MNKRLAASAASVVALCTGLAYAQAPTNENTPPAQTSQTARRAASSMAKADVDFMKQAAENGHAEIQASKTVLAKGTDPDVKAFAQKMVDDHTRVGDELASLAQQKGVKIPNGPSLMQKGKEKLLEARKGSSLDAEYVKSMGVKAHEDTVKLFQKASTQAKDPDVKAFAAKTLPELQHHLQMARELKVQDVSSSTSSSRAASSGMR